MRRVWDMMTKTAPRRFWMFIVPAVVGFFMFVTYCVVVVLRDLDRMGRQLD